LRHSNLLLLLCFVLFAITLWGQQDDAPLGDVARKARQTKASQPHAKVTATTEDSAPSGEAGKLDLDPCALLTTNEVEEVLGGPLASAAHPVSQESGVKACGYTTAKSPTTGATGDLLIASESVFQNGHDMWREHISAFRETVPGVGDDADRVQGRDGLNIRKGRVFLTVRMRYAFADRKPSPADIEIEHEKERELGKKIVAKLPYSQVGSYTLHSSQGGSDTSPASSNYPAGYPWVPGGATQGTGDEAALRAQRDACVANVEDTYNKKLAAAKTKQEYIPGKEMDQFQKMREDALKECDRPLMDKRATNP